MFTKNFLQCSAYSFHTGTELMNVSTSANEPYSVNIETSRNSAYETSTATGVIGGEYECVN